MVTINGKPEDVAGKTVSQYIKDSGHDKTNLAIERNGYIIPKSQYDTAVFEDGDTVAVGSFVGGG